MKNIFLYGWKNYSVDPGVTDDDQTRSATNSGERATENMNQRKQHTAHRARRVGELENINFNICMRFSRSHNSLFRLSRERAE